MIEYTAKGAPENLTGRLAGYLVDTRYEDIPASHFTILKKSILDTWGTWIAGYDTDGIRELNGLVRDWGGRQEATVLMWGNKAPVHYAALLNATMARALDFDDNEDNGIHPSAALLPTLVSVSEKAGGLSGKEFLTAFALGRDFTSRINFSNRDYRGFDSTPVCVVFGTAAIAARVLGLDKNQMAHALGFALNACAGTYQANIDACHSVRLNEGLTALRGVMSAEFARAGLTSVQHVFEGVWGYHHLYANDAADWECLTKDLGARFYGGRINFKRWPSCGSTQSATDVAVVFAREGIETSSIERVVVRMSKKSCMLVGKPFEIRGTPSVDTQFNVRYCVANALVRKWPVIEHFNDPEEIRNPEVLSLAEKTEVVPDDSFGMSVNTGKYLRAEVDIYFKDGTMRTKGSDAWKGYSQDPLDWDYIIRKYWDNVAYGKDVVDRAAAQQILDMTMHLEDVENCNEFIRLMTPKGGGIA